VPFAPGGGTDLTSRAVGLSLAESFGQPVMIDNRAGAAGNIGAEATTKSLPDGYTLCTAFSTHAVNPAMHAKPGYDLVRDFAPITRMTAGRASAGPREERDRAPRPRAREARQPELRLIRHRRVESPLGRAARGDDPRVAHARALQGRSAGPDRRAGRPDPASPFSTYLQAQAHVRAGRLRMLAISSAGRSRILPDLPAVSESGVPGSEASGWYGIVAPRGPSPPNSTVR